MDNSLTLEERRHVANLMEVTNYLIYKNFVKTHSVASNYKGNARQPGTQRSDTNITFVQQFILNSP